MNTTLEDVRDVTVQAYRSIDELKKTIRHLNQHGLINRKETDGVQRHISNLIKDTSDVDTFAVYPERSTDIESAHNALAVLRNAVRTLAVVYNDDKFLSDGGLRKTTDRYETKEDLKRVSLSDSIVEGTDEVLMEFKAEIDDILDMVDSKVKVIINFVRAITDYNLYDTWYLNNCLDNDEMHLVDMKLPTIAGINNISAGIDTYLANITHVIDIVAELNDPSNTNLADNLMSIAASMKDVTDNDMFKHRTVSEIYGKDYCDSLIEALRIFRTPEFRSSVRDVLNAAIKVMVTDKDKMTYVTYIALVSVVSSMELELAHLIKTELLNSCIELVDFYEDLEMKYNKHIK